MIGKLITHDRSFFVVMSKADFMIDWPSDFELFYDLFDMNLAV